jgi:hypothetical protein
MRASCYKQKGSYYEAGVGKKKAVDKSSNYYQIVGVYLGDTIYSQNEYTLEKSQQVARQFIAKMRKKKRVSDAFVEIREIGNIRSNDESEMDSIDNWYADDIWESGVKKKKKDKIVGRCKICNRGFTQKDYDNAAKGVVGDECLVGDWDDICYPCQFKKESGIKNTDFEFWEDENLMGYNIRLIYFNDDKIFEVTVSDPDGITADSYYNTKKQAYKAFNEIKEEIKAGKF